MKKLIEPNYFEPQTLGDLFRTGEPFCDWPESLRACLLRCFRPIVEFPLDDLPRQLKALLTEVFEPATGISAESSEGSPSKLAAAFVRMFWHRERDWDALWKIADPGRTVLANFVKEAAHGGGQSLALWSMDNALDYERFPVEVLLRHLDIGELVDWSLCANLLETKQRRATTPKCPTADSARDLQHPVFWLDTALNYQLKGSEDDTPNLPDDEAMSPLQAVALRFEPRFQGHVGTGDWRATFPMLAALEAVLMKVGSGVHGTGWGAYRGQLVSWFSFVDSKKPESSNDRDALYVWFWLALRCFSEQYGASGGVVEQRVADRLVRAALCQLGMLRTEVRDRGKEWDWDFHTEALQVAVAFGGLWQSIKQLLLVLRGLPEPAVTRDLRYWDEQGKEQCPAAFGLILRWIANLLGNPQIRAEREKDPELRNLRTEFSSFCLKRLKTKGAIGVKPLKAPSNEDFYEPNAIWRACFARAACELRINPRGTSHHIAWWSSQNDPDETVRECSHQLYDTLRHQTPLDPGLSPRRPLVAAFWWLRQAHLRSSGVEIDERGAQRTRSKELRRTEELHKSWRQEAKSLPEIEEVTP